MQTVICSSRAKGGISKVSTPNHESLQAPPALSAEVGHRAATRGRVSRDVLEAHWPLWQGSRWSQIPPSHHRGLRREDRRAELRFLSGAQAPFSEGLASFSKYDLPILCLFLLLSLTLRCLFPSALGLFRRSLLEMATTRSTAPHLNLAPLPTQAVPRPHGP